MGFMPRSPATIGARYDDGRGGNKGAEQGNPPGIPTANGQQKERNKILRK